MKTRKMSTRQNEQRNAFISGFFSTSSKYVEKKDFSFANECFNQWANGDGYNHVSEYTQNSTNDDCFYAGSNIANMEDKLTS